MPSGKLDRRALPPPAVAVETSVRPPATDTEKLLCELFADVLGRTEVSADSDFFALGGDSILCVKLIGAARRGGVKLSPRDVFDHKRVAALAAFVDGRR